MTDPQIRAAVRSSGNKHPFSVLEECSGDHPAANFPIVRSATQLASSESRYKKESPYFTLVTEYLGRQQDGMLVCCSGDR